jgi:mannose-1-phosphate guanylyltransferase
MVFPFQTAKLIQKPWGSETWIADGERTPYALKKILFLAGQRSSLQVHQFKFETNFVVSGTGSFQICEEIFDSKNFLELANKAEQEAFIKSAIGNLIEVPIKAGDVIDVKPGQIHRVLAKTDLTFIEASTTELDDVIRLADDSNRDHGKIASEHNN